ncbi:MAG: hypothetical protein Q9162_005925 [Coniocarpon cinnabarinum]
MAEYPESLNGAGRPTSLTWCSKTQQRSGSAPLPQNVTHMARRWRSMKNNYFFDNLPWCLQMASRSPSSSPESTTFPTGHGHTASEQLTPRSKVRRMLSAFDDDSADEDESAGHHNKELQPGHSQTQQSDIPGISSRRAKIPFQLFENDETDDGPAATIKAAERSETFDDPDDSHAKQDLGAYERVREQLLSRQSNQNPEGARPSPKDGRSESPSSPLPRRSNPISHSLTPSYSRQSSPGLFVSPTKSPNQPDADSDRADDIAMSDTRSRLQQLVARKRREREERELAAQHSSDSEEEPTATHDKESVQTSRHAARRQHSNANRGADRMGNKSDSRPARKASKKALAEMNKETQRFSRNMQLTRQAQTKTKFTTEGLFKKFNFRQPRVADVEPAQQLPLLSSSSLTQGASEVEQAMGNETPPSSPPSLAASGKQQTGFRPPEDLDEDTALPSLEELRSSIPASKALDSSPRSQPNRHPHRPTGESQAKPSLRRFMKSKKQTKPADSDDDDLKIIGSKSKSHRIAALDDIRLAKSTEHQSLLALRALAHLNDRNHERRLKGSLKPAELNAVLTRRAREQAKLAELEKIQEAKDKGRYVESADEKERNQMQIESMIEKAQRENAELAKREKETAKRAGQGDQHDPLDSEEDEDFRPSDDGDEDEVAFSGSEDEERLQAFGQSDQDENQEDNERDDEADEADDDDADEDHKLVDAYEERLEQNNNPMIDDTAEEQSDEEGGSLDQDFSDDHLSEPDADLGEDGPKVRQSRKSRVIEEDDSDEGGEPVTPAPAVTKTPGSKTSIVQAFGFGQAKSPALGLSQLWGGTMAETQTQGKEDTLDSQQDSLAFLRGVPQAQMLPFGDTLAESEDSAIHDSQDEQLTQQTPARATNVPKEPQTISSNDQPSPMFDATQDFGFQGQDSPLSRGEEALPADSYCTIDTVLLSAADSPVARRKGHIRRGRLPSEIQVQSSDSKEDQSVNTGSAPQQSLSENAFSALSKGAKQTLRSAEYDKNKSEARDMVQEQAEESEDEYAGLGGASDDDSGSEMDEDMQKLIDDETRLNVNQGKAAEFHAEWKRVQDEKDVTKLFRDVTTGALRRQRDNGANMLDWDDDDEREARRRAIRLRKEARQRKALTDNGKLVEVVNNPKRQAFLSAVEDFAGDDEVTFLDEGEPRPESQTHHDESDGSSLKRKRHSDSDNQEVHEDDQSHRDAEAMPPPKSRRTNNARPQSTLDIRRTLSSLLDEPSENDVDVIADSQEGAVRGAYSTAGQRLQSPIASDSDKENDSDLDVDSHWSREGSPDGTPPQKIPSPPRHRRTTPSTSKATVIDRMALKRQSSSTTQGASAGTRLAFQAKSDNNASFKIPSLLRRATTNASMSSTEGSLAEKSAAAGITGASKEGVRMGGSKKSSVNFHVREAERREKVERMETERKSKRVKIGKAFGGTRGLSRVGGGKFE